MNTRADTSNWIEDNQQALGAELDWLQAVIENAANGSRPEDVIAPGAASRTLDFLAGRFGLSPFERSIILLCAGMELNAGFARLCGQLAHDASREYPTFGLALALLPGAHWSAISPGSPLRNWQLVQIGNHSRITSASLALDERILHFLLGIGHIDRRLGGLARPMSPGEPLPASQQLEMERLTALWRDRDLPPLVMIGGNDPEGAREVAVQACAGLGLQPLLMHVRDLDQPAEERSRLARLLSREYLLSNAALLIGGCEEPAPWLDALLDQLDCPTILLGAASSALRRNAAVLEVDKPTATEQRALWRQALNGFESYEESWLPPLAAQFDFSAQDIANTIANLRAEMVLGAPLEQALWQQCRQHSRGGLGHLAQRITPRAGWDDLVLPAGQKAILRDISRQVHHRATVYETWGFAARCGRGLGISALFSGESGTGKTMAAEVLAGELGLDLYRIDLSAVVSKYIGETEKNLERLFRAAETSGAILLFDEADALFGKRSDVKDSHDRYANIELAYLLQRMEAYRGLSILTSNMKSSLDTAFLRRIRFVVQFPFPDTAQRDEIWRRVLPDGLPRAELSTSKLARLHVTGGNIRNIAMNAAFLAAEKGDPLCMADLARATRMEYAKLEKPLNESELGNWS